MPNTNLPKIGLNCIVLNEEKVIKRMLDSVAPLVDYYVIVDTGSTDNTKKIIKETMDGHGIPGEIVDHEWKDFCTARNAALDAIIGKAEWGFWIDADEQLIFNQKLDKPKLHAFLDNLDSCSTPVEYGASKYFRTQLFRVTDKWTWRGAVHEIMFPDEGWKQRGGQIGDVFHTFVTPDGNSWGDGSRETQKKKYLQHAKMLEEYIKEDKDVRWVFYLAQSYRDAFEYKKSEEWYTKRIQMGGGYWEELYYSALMVAVMKLNQKKPWHEVLAAYDECGKYDMNRAEHLIPVMRHYQINRNYPIAYMYSHYAYKNLTKNPFPKSTLFIDKNVYDWQIYDQHCINAFYMGKLDESRSAYNKLRKAINNGLVPPGEHKRILDNQQWFDKRKHDEMKRQAKKMGVLPLPRPADDNNNQGKPAINPEVKANVDQKPQAIKLPDHLVKVNK